MTRRAVALIALAAAVFAAWMTAAELGQREQDRHDELMDSLDEILARLRHRPERHTR